MELTMIADLTTLGLSADAVSRRVLSIGGSDANTLMSGDDAAVLALWECKTGRRASDDLSDVLPVVMGSFTEPLNAAWFQKQTGLEIAERDLPLAHPEDSWRTATLDGRLKDGAIWEAKHVNAFGKPEETLARYQPQLHHNMSVAGAVKAHLSIFRGNADWVWFEVEYDPSYGEAVRKAEWAFWMAVQADEPPVPYPAPPPPKVDAIREVDFTGNNAWAALAADWLSTREAAAKCDAAKDALKKLIEPDVKRAFGHGVEFSRDKRGALRIAALET
jgi:predicted phage-related endonuclease